MILERGRETEREIFMWKRNIDRLPPAQALARDRTRRLLVPRTTLSRLSQPARAAGSDFYFVEKTGHKLRNI